MPFTENILIDGSGAAGKEGKERTICTVVYTLTKFMGTIGLY